MTTQVVQAEPQVRDFAFDHFWRFTAERQQIFLRRRIGAPGPWTDDPILARYKFCNVYRAADRVSQYLIRDVAYRDATVSSDDLAFQIVAFRHFSNIATWNSVTNLLGHPPTLEDLASDRFEHALTATRERNGGLYTGAFILCATDAYGRRTKHLNHVELFRHMFLRTGLARRIVEARSLELLFDELKQYPLMGDFMSYQIAIDLNYSPLVDFSEDDFTRPGPGAVRGLKKIFVHTGGRTPSELIMWLVDRQERELATRGLAFNGLFGRRLHAIDVQNLLCEVDKYLRVAAPELASGRTRIKATFRPDPAPIDLFFPPKWALTPTGSDDGLLAAEELTAV